MNMRLLPFLVISLFLIQCHSSANNINQPISAPAVTEVKTDTIPLFTPIDTEFDRTTIKAALAEKIATHEPLIVHAYIPLCDNENQGIVPTSVSLGDGLNLKTNLYWATSGGTKSYFKKQPDWQLIQSTLDLNENVLERVVFKKNYANTIVYFIADAYRGDRMSATINDYLSTISCSHYETIHLSQHDSIVTGGNADLVIFNGHNGMMDGVTLQPWENKSDKRTDIVMNSCVSYNYLNGAFLRAGGYPLLRTKTLLYPGAYVLEQVVDDWVAGIDETQLCLNAGATYCKKHDCGKGTKVFKSGW